MEIPMIGVPGTHMTLVLIGKDLVLEGLTTKKEDKHGPGIYNTDLFLILSSIHFLTESNVIWTLSAKKDLSATEDET